MIGDIHKYSCHCCWSRPGCVVDLRHNSHATLRRRSLGGLDFPTDWKILAKACEMWCKKHPHPCTSTQRCSALDDKCFAVCSNSPIIRYQHAIKYSLSLKVRVENHERSSSLSSKHRSTERQSCFSSNATLRHQQEQGRDALKIACS